MAEKNCPLLKLAKILLSSLDLEAVLPQASSFLVESIPKVTDCLIFGYSAQDGNLHLLSKYGPTAPGNIRKLADDCFQSERSILSPPSKIKDTDKEVILFRLDRLGFAVGVVCFLGDELPSIQEPLRRSADIIAASVQNGISYQNLIAERGYYENLTRETQVLYQLTRALSISFNSDEVIKQLLTSMADIFRADFHVLLLLDEDRTGRVYIDFLTHFDLNLIRIIQDKVKKVWEDLKKTPITIIKSQTLSLPTINRNTRGLDIRMESQIQSWLSAPLVGENRTVGLLCIAAIDEDRFRDYHVEFLNIVAGLSVKVIENIRLNERMKTLATLDGLTGVCNHRTFQEKLEEVFILSRRYQTPLSLIMADIDHFKAFNDTYGHQIGDAVLKAVAKTILHTMREVDITCRYGGEEFVVILPQTNLIESGEAAERLRKEIEKREFSVDDYSLKITASLGVSSFPMGNQTKCQHLIAQADAMLYQAKRGGRNRAVVWPGSNKK
ncbi:MAG: hypothetical protein B6244_11375 [Candidatus Cloacimonetes bacterium 4572_55]|nr:MAG: hypothetical protein B6244_11375 [Candidatus Cloacimonetes bacterium 4572_55]